MTETANTLSSIQRSGEIALPDSGDCAANDAFPALTFFRVRLLLRIESPVTLHPHHAGLVYAVISEAYGLAEGVQPVIPDGLIPLAPEQTRTIISANQTFALGFTVVSADPVAATRIAQFVLTGLQLLGRERRPRRGAPPLRGNFSVVEAIDLVSGRPLPLGRNPVAFGLLAHCPVDHISREVLLAQSQPKLTLRFLAPLRTHRPKNDRTGGRSMFDSTYFDPGAFLFRLATRLAGLGIPFPVLSRDEYAAMVQLDENRLVWLDVLYGSGGKSVDGAVGRVVLRTSNFRVTSLLVLGQYVHVGEATKWGLGGYRIEELGEDRFACARSKSLAEWAFESASCDRVSSELDLPAGRLRAAARSALTREFVPNPVRRVEIPKGSGGSRTLSIPSRIDLALQRVLLQQLAPGLDRFFEDSSLAYRHGLGRRSAARRIESAFREGFTFAVRADFHSFFDSVSLALLKEKLDAYLCDDVTVSLILKWVASGSPIPDHGLPTGSALSPLLSNLFLDEFDEAIAHEGARLVRHADDFLILTRSADDAAALFDTAKQLADQLSLKLNDAKSGLLDLREPFVFLGMRFELREKWTSDGPHPPRRVDELGWSETRRTSPPPPVNLRLPGETDIVPISDGTVLIVGPTPGRLSVERNDVVFSPADGRPSMRTPCQRVSHLLLLGEVEMTTGAVHELLECEIPITLADQNGRCLGAVDGAGAWVDAETLRAQIVTSDDPIRRLAFARAAIASKLHNYSALARLLERSSDKPISSELSEFSKRAQLADSVDSILGLEGAGAAFWWNLFAEHLGQGFDFERRVAPNATDPVNVLLNIAYSALHRQMVIACRVAGLEPALGVLHRSRSGHAALASDLQESFRHLCDRAVIMATRVLSPKDFSRRSGHPARLHIAFPAARRFAWILQEQFSLGCVAAGGSSPCPYRQHMITQARHVRRAILDSSEPFSFFRHPGPPEPKT